MAASAITGPQSVTGPPPLLAGPVSTTGGSATYVDYNQDAAPSLFWNGVGIRDPRFLARVGQTGPQPLPPNPSPAVGAQDFGWYAPGGAWVLDQAPSPLGAANVVPAANVTNGTPMTLAGASTGIVVVSAPVTIQPTGLVVPAGCLSIDGPPAWLPSGPSGAFGFFDPTHAVSRALSITGVAGGLGGQFRIRGFDIYGTPMSEVITATAGATTTNGFKAWEFIQSVTPLFTDAHNYSVGTQDVFGFPMFVRNFSCVVVFWNNTPIVAAAGFVAGVTTTATPTTGDTRGTYAVQASPSDGVKRLQVRVFPHPIDMAATTVAAQINGLVGVIQA